MADVVTTLPDGSVSIEYEMSAGDVFLRDTIVVPASVYNSWVQADLDAEKQARFASWQVIVAPRDEVL